MSRIDLEQADSVGIRIPEEFDVERHPLQTDGQHHALGELCHPYTHLGWEGGRILIPQETRVIRVPHGIDDTVNVHLVLESITLHSCHQPGDGLFCYARSAADRSDLRW